MKERMMLKHQNTGKWARMALEHGKHDKNLRAAYQEATQYGNELTAKMHEMPYDKNGDDANDDADENDWSDEENSKKKVSEITKSQLSDILNDDLQASVADKYDGKYKKIFEMDFMKKAVEQQREKAKIDAQNILKELQQMEMDEDGQLLDGSDNEDHSNEMAELEKNHEELERAKHLVDAIFNKKSSASASTNKRKMEMPVVKSLESSAVSADDNTDANDNKRSKRKSTNSIALGSTVSSAVENSADGDGALVNGQKNNSKQKGTKKESKVGINSVPVQVPAPAPIPLSAPAAPVAPAPAPAALNARRPLLLQKSQEDLVSMAFAAPDLEDEFKEMKNAAIEEELGISDKKKAILSDGKEDAV